jgi:hypothetical protein
MREMEEKKKRVDAASKKLERRSKYLSSLIKHTKVKGESDQQERPRTRGRTRRRWRRRIGEERRSEEKE